MVGQLTNQLKAARVVPVIRHDDAAIARRACELLVEEGALALEITMTVPRAAVLIAELRRELPDVAIGAGTVLSREDTQAVLAAEAQFVVSPCWNKAVADDLRNADVPYLPGAMTPGEVFHHAQSGAHLVKVFPADAAGGPTYLTALKAVLPDVELMPTGGVTADNANDYLRAGAICVGMGGNLMPAQALENKDEQAARAQIRAALSPIKS